MKKIVSFGLVVVMLLCFVVPCGAIEPPCSEWAQPYVDLAYQNGILDKNKNYDYQEPITREAFCELIDAFLIKTNYYEERASKLVTQEALQESPFADTDNKSVLKLYLCGFVKGKSETEFCPDELLTREEAAYIAMLLAYAFTPSMDGLTKFFGYFNDGSEVSEWAIDAMFYVSDMKYMQGVGDGLFAPKDNLTTEQAVTILQRIYDNYPNYQIEPKECDITLDVLVQYGIVEAEDLNKQGNISVLDALITMDKARGEYTEEIGVWEKWWDTYEPVADLPDSIKGLLYRLRYEGRRRILPNEDFSTFSLDDPLNEYHAVLFTTRLVGDAYYDFNGPSIPLEPDRLYALAFKKGLIDSPSTENAQTFIAREEFYALLHKALYTDYVDASGGEIYVRYWIDYHNGQEKLLREKSF